MVLRKGKEDIGSRANEGFRCGACGPLLGGQKSQAHFQSQTSTSFFRQGRVTSNTANNSQDGYRYVDRRERRVLEALAISRRVGWQRWRRSNKSGQNAARPHDMDHHTLLHPQQRHWAIVLTVYLQIWTNITCAQATARYILVHEQISRLREVCKSFVQTIGD